jgi:hypothetical protein
VILNQEFGAISQTEYLSLAKQFANEESNIFQEETIGNILVKFIPLTRRTFIGNINKSEIRSFYIADFRSENPFNEAVELAKAITTKNK